MIKTDNLARKDHSLLDKVSECPICHSKNQIEVERTQYLNSDGSVRHEEFCTFCKCKYGKNGHTSRVQAMLYARARTSYTSRTAEASIKAWNKKVKAVVEAEEKFKVESVLKSESMEDAFGTPIHVGDMVCFACPLGQRGYDLAKAVVLTLNVEKQTAVLFNELEPEFSAIHPNITQRKIAKLATI